MACQPSSTFLLVASSTSKAGTICPAGSASILIEPCESFSTRSPNILKCSCSVLLAGQVDCILIDFGACACAPALRNVAAMATAMERLSIGSPGLWAGARGHGRVGGWAPGMKLVSVGPRGLGGGDRTPAVPAVSITIAPHGPP